MLLLVIVSGVFTQVELVRLETLGFGVLDTDGYWRLSVLFRKEGLLSITFSVLNESSLQLSWRIFRLRMAAFPDKLPERLVNAAFDDGKIFINHLSSCLFGKIGKTSNS